MVIETKDEVAEFVSMDELFPTASYEGTCPEFDLTDLSKY